MRKCLLLLLQLFAITFLSAQDSLSHPFEIKQLPPGHGTKLGLSLSYDIIKAHGGELIVNSVEGEGAAFIIELPL